MTRLKLLWRDSLSESDRDYWRAQFKSTQTQAALRQELHARYHIHLRRDSQLNRFRDWVQELDAQIEESRAMAADQAELEQQGLTGEQLREELLRRMKTRALARGDFSLGLRAIAADLKVETLLLGMKKFNLSVRTKLGPALARAAEVPQGGGARWSRPVGMSPVRSRREPLRVER